jgi:Mrp family chromosome partitioning ATPase
MNERRTTRSWEEDGTSQADAADATDAADAPEERTEHRVVWDEEAPRSYKRGAVVGRVDVIAQRQPVRARFAAAVEAEVVTVREPSASGPRPRVVVAPARPATASTTLVLVPATREPMIAPRSVTARALPTRPLLPRSNGTLDQRLVTVADPDSPRATGFRVLRDNLISRGLPRVVLVSSAAAGDGKTTCAINLAATLAERGSDTILLVDASLRHPALAEVFGIDENTPTAPGLDEEGLGPFKVVELTPHLHVAAILRGGDEQAALLDRLGFDGYLERLSQLGHDHVIIDAPALDGASLIGSLVGAADAVILAVRAGSTTKRALRRALDEIADAKLLGVALVEADPRR